MGAHEKKVTQSLLRDSAAFVISADGLDRSYQGEVRAVLWKLPSFLKDWLIYEEKAGWLQVLGPKSLWVVERI